MRGFTKLKKKHLLKISAVYLIGNPEICQDTPSCGQDDQTLLFSKMIANFDKPFESQWKSNQKDIPRTDFLAKSTLSWLLSSKHHHWGHAIVVESWWHLGAIVRFVVLLLQASVWFMSFQEFSYLKVVYSICMCINVSSVVEFKRWWVLKCKIFAQESTC